MSAIMKDPKRIRAVCEHIADHFMNKVNPNGFKAQVVCYDRECCVLYKHELDRLLGEATSTIVIDTNNDKADIYNAKLLADRAVAINSIFACFSPLKIHPFYRVAIRFCDK